MTSCFWSGKIDLDDWTNFDRKLVNYSLAFFPLQFLVFSRISIEDVFCNVAGACTWSYNDVRPIMKLQNKINYVESKLFWQWYRFSAQERKDIRQTNHNELDYLRSAVGGKAWTPLSFKNINQQTTDIQNKKDNVLYQQFHSCRRSHWVACFPCTSHNPAMETHKRTILSWKKNLGDFSAQTKRFSVVKNEVDILFFLKKKNEEMTSSEERKSTHNMFTNFKINPKFHRCKKTCARYNRDFWCAALELHYFYHSANTLQRAAKHWKWSLECFHRTRLVYVREALDMPWTMCAYIQSVS